MTGPNLTHWPERPPKHLPLPETSLWYNLEVAATPMQWSFQSTR
jgi:hypothetical protein